MNYHVILQSSEDRKTFEQPHIQNVFWKLYKTSKKTNRCSLNRQHYGIAKRLKRSEEKCGESIV
ncbi:MAG: hypothetical protein C6W54_11620 [Bacillaceae bacterium]|uniref:Uncharacterized protein n=1 Tax=Aeribacillus pallidus TaxID=33936 RepID=A0A165WV12_9BACI|nr:hypothetical protein AZI98_15280 [Aeribacillus pallidus]REJ22709.1 MAG: hypothetical protein C6W54_11620 [Bacillaceae bacterium]